ncbi:hypothetical protein KJ632_02065, partial [Patescibacteria group bacterium]|nr:hypothetical protein [Patescibacteria group bacterium]
SFIIGRDNTLKVILATYISAIAADSFGNLIGSSFQGSPMFLRVLESASFGNEQEAIVFLKVVLFVGFVIIFAVRGAFEVHTSEDRSSIARIVMSVIYAVMSAGLIISVILVFVSGVPFIGGGAEETTTTALWSLSNQSNLIKMILEHTYIWFSVPALAFLVHSVHSTKTD